MRLTLVPPSESPPLPGPSCGLIPSQTASRVKPDDRLFLERSAANLRLALADLTMVGDDVDARIRDLQFAVARATLGIIDILDQATLDRLRAGERT